MVGKRSEISQGRRGGRERQFERRCSLRRSNSADGGSSFGVRHNLQPDKEIVPASTSLRARDVERWQIARHVGRLQVVPGKQQHHLWRESHPPGRRFDFCDRRSSFLGRLLRTGSQGRAAARECDNVQNQTNSSWTTLRHKIAEVPQWSFHGESIRKKEKVCQS